MVEWTLRCRRGGRGLGGGGGVRVCWVGVVLVILTLAVAVDCQLRPCQHFHRRGPRGARRRAGVGGSGVVGTDVHGWRPGGGGRRLWPGRRTADKSRQGAKEVATSTS